MEFKINQAEISDCIFADEISSLYTLSAQERDIGIAIRKPDYIKEKITKKNAIIAKYKGELAGFCYIETFSNEGYVSNSGLIVKPKFRGKGLAKAIKKIAVKMARDRYPNAKLFGITTSNVVMKINSNLGYIPVAFHELTDDEEFWRGCSSCKNYDILRQNNCKMCLCTGMLAPSKNDMSRKKKLKSKIKSFISKGK